MVLLGASKRAWARDADTRSEGGSKREMKKERENVRKIKRAAAGLRVD